PRITAKASAPSWRSAGPSSTAGELALTHKGNSVTRIARLVAAAALVSLPLAAHADPDYAGKCQQAVSKKASVAAGDVKVRGKYKGQDGRIMVDFKLADGRVGVCREQAGDASVDEVKMEEKKAP